MVASKKHVYEGLNNGVKPGKRNDATRSRNATVPPRESNSYEDRTASAAPIAPTGNSGGTRESRSGMAMVSRK